MDDLERCTVKFNGKQCVDDADEDIDADLIDDVNQNWMTAGHWLHTGPDGKARICNVHLDLVADA